MRELPLLMNGPMVRAILEGRKTVTRRVVKPQPSGGFVFPHPTQFKDGIICWCNRPHPQNMLVGEWYEQRMPYQVGDRLYVRETTVNVEDHGYLGPVFAVSDEGVATREGGLGPADDDCEIEPEDIKLRTALHMPKAWARIWLEVTDVRVERLKDITEKQARAEGAAWSDGNPVNGLPTSLVVDARDTFENLWDGLAKEGARWADNPWVWAVSFRRVEGPSA